MLLWVPQGICCLEVQQTSAEVSELCCDAAANQSSDHTSHDSTSGCDCDLKRHADRPVSFTQGHVHAEPPTFALPSHFDLGSWLSEALIAQASDRNFCDSLRLLKHESLSARVRDHLVFSVLLV